MKPSFPQYPHWPEHVAPPPLNLEAIDAGDPEEATRLQRAVDSEIDEATYFHKLYLHKNYSRNETIEPDGTLSVEYPTEADRSAHQRLGQRVLDITNIIQTDSSQTTADGKLLPGRVVTDFGKPWPMRTIHDPELAHLTALTIGGNLEALSNYDRRRAAGEFMWPWEHLAARRHIKGAIVGESAAAMAYRNNPDVDPATIRATIASRERLFKDYRYIQGTEQQQ